MPFRLTVIRGARRMLDVLLLLLIAIVLGTLVIARILPALAGGTSFVVGGGSMEPTIPLGSAVVATPVAASDLAAGDIVSLQVGTQHAVFTHRIVRLAERDGAVWLETKGDANPEPDPALVPAASVIGRVFVIVPWAGYLVALLNSIQGIVFVVSMGILVLAATWFLEMLEDGLAESSRRGAGTGLVPGSPAPSTGQGAAG